MLSLCCRSFLVSDGVYILVQGRQESAITPCGCSVMEGGVGTGEGGPPGQQKKAVGEGKPGPPRQSWGSTDRRLWGVTPRFSSCPAHSPGEDTAHCCEILSPVSQGCISLWQPCLPILRRTSRQDTFSDWISNRALCHEVMLQFPSRDVGKKPRCFETKELGSNPARLGYF